MRVGCLQFNPNLGAVKDNIDRANAILAANNPTQLDLLVLPELAFTGYNFPSLEAIKPYLEPTAAGITTKWAVETAWRLGCTVTVGYPEISTDSSTGVTRNYNSTVTVSADGRILENYRKSFLYYTDETWASEGPAGSAFAPSPEISRKPFFVGQLDRLGRVGHGICMDINPYRFTAPWTDFEFANTMLRENVRLVILSTAWLTRLLPEELEIEPDKPDMETVAYWTERFFPLIESAPREEIIVVFANRCGMEGNMAGSSTHIENGQVAEEGDRVCYAGSSCVMRFQGGGVRMFDRGEGVAILGKSEEGLLVVDTSQHAKYALQTGPRYMQ